MNGKKFRYFAIFGTMRSGSNLLEQSLNQYAGIRCFGELFNPAFIGGPKATEDFNFTLSQRERDPLALVDAMVDASGDSLPGFRIFDGHDERVMQKALSDPECAKILLKRDFLDSYVSLKIARKTDQWLLRNSPHRKHAKVRFDAEEFRIYCKEKQQYFTTIRHSLQESGQTAFELEYPEQTDIKILNGLAAFLGVKDPLKSVSREIRRQNPEPMSEKVENYSEMQVELQKNGHSFTETVADVGSQLRANIPRMASCIAHPVLFAPIPGGPNEEILRWMNALDSGDDQENYAAALSNGEILHTGHSQRTLFEWMQSNPDVFVLTAVRHPVVRAYDAFMTKIYASGPDTYDVIRKQLIESFDLELPTNDQEKEDYTVKQHRAAFHSFLRFLKNNLAGQTSIRIDGLWAQQMSFLTGFNSAVPVSLVAREGRLDRAFRYVESMLDIQPPELGAPIGLSYEFPLDKIYTRQTENLTRKSYSMDYIRFGFDDYQAALEV